MAGRRGIQDPKPSGQGTYEAPPRVLINNLFVFFFFFFTKQFPRGASVGPPQSMKPWIRHEEHLLLIHPGEGGQW